LFDTSPRIPQWQDHKPFGEKDSFTSYRNTSFLYVKVWQPRARYGFGRNRE
jgi:hypothetical protein